MCKKYFWGGGLIEGGLTKSSITLNSIYPHGGLFEGGGLFVKNPSRAGGLFEGAGAYWKVGV